MPQPLSFFSLCAVAVRHRGAPNRLMPRMLLRIIIIIFPTSAFVGIFHSLNSLAFSFWHNRLFSPFVKPDNHSHIHSSINSMAIRRL